MKDGEAVEQDLGLEGFTDEEKAALNDDGTGDNLPESKEPAAKAETAEPAKEEGGRGEADKGQQQQQQKAKAPPPPGFVEKEALHEARKELRELRDKTTRMESLFERMQKERAEAKKGDVEAEIPPYDQDPVGNLSARLAQTQRQLAELGGEAKQRSEREQQQARSNEMLNRYATTVRNYSQEVKDFNEAYDFLSKTLDQELQARGYDDPVERTNILQYEEGVMVARAFHNGKNPAEVIYNYAKHRGFGSKPPASAEPEKSKIERLQEGQKAAKSLAGAKAVVDDDSVSLEKLASLEGEDFDRAWAKLQRAGGLG